MFLSVRINTYNPSYKSLTEEQWVDLRKVIPTLPAEKPDWHYDPHVVQDEGFRKLAEYGLEVELQKDDPSINGMLVKLQDEIDKLKMKESTIPEMIRAGAAVQIAIPDLGLMYITEAKVLDNACTDDLNTSLAEGWRLLAVCPPNAQRRPSYVLGRSKERTT